jgi:hypothetical protein
MTGCNNSGVKADTSKTMMAGQVRRRSKKALQSGKSSRTSWIPQAPRTRSRQTRFWSSRAEAERELYFVKTWTSDVLHELGQHFTALEGQL